MPTLTVARAGEYDVRLSAYLASIGAFSAVYAIFCRAYVNALATQLGVLILELVPSAASAGATCSVFQPSVAIAAGAVIGLASFTTAGSTGRTAHASIELLPKRIA